MVRAGAPNCAGELEGCRWVVLATAEFAPALLERAAALRRAARARARAEGDGGAATPGARAAQLARLQGWRAPTWAEHFARVEAFMARLAGEGWPRVGLARPGACDTIQARLPVVQEGGRPCTHL
jgi:hypothetical protein